MTPQRAKRITDVLNKRQPGLTVVLENVQDPHNISAVMRTADAVGVQEIYVLNSEIPRHNKWGKRSSSSASKWLHIHQFEYVDACFIALRKKYDQVFATHLSQTAIGLHQMDFTQKIALVFGNEHSGITEKTLKYCDGNFIIPQVGIIKSLNISVACAITLYEAYRQKSLAGHYDIPQLTAEDYGNLATEWGLQEND